MAKGTISAPVVDATGTRLTVHIEGFTVGATPLLGSTPADYKIAITVVSKGYTGTVLGTRTRTVYADFNTYLEPPPANSYAGKQTASGDGIDIEVALNEPIYDLDDVAGSGTDPTVTIAAGAFRDSAGADPSALSLSCSNVAVTNSSTLAYGLPAARWACLCKERLTSLSLPLALSAFYQHGISAVVFSAADEHSHTVTGTPITEETISASDGNPPIYEGTLDLTGFTSGDIVTADSTIYPAVGDTPFTSVGTAFPNTALSGWPFLLDSAGTFGVTVCYVDPTNGSSSNAAYDVANDATARANPVDTIATALTKIAAFNNTRTPARNNLDAGIVYLLAGSHITGQLSLQTSSKCFVTITPASGVAATDCPITDYAAAGRNIPKFTKFLGVRITPISGTRQTMFIGASGDFQAWKGCTFVSPDATANKEFYSGNAAGYVALIGNTVTDYYNGVSPATSVVLIARGNIVTNANNVAFKTARLVLANSYTGVNGTADGIWGVSADLTVGNVIVAYNKAYHLKNAAISNAFVVNRLTVVGNVFEIVGATNNAVVLIGDYNCDDLLFLHNTIVGQRTNILNDIVAPLVDKTVRRACIKFNSVKSLNVCGHGDDNSQTLTGWRPVQYGTGVAGNVARVDLEPGYYLGAYSAMEVTVNYVSDKSREGTDVGSGDYTPAAGSTLLNRVPANGRLLKYDLFGRTIPNDGTGATGAIQLPPVANSGAVAWWWN